jgi:hypothetical protein
LVVNLYKLYLSQNRNNNHLKIIIMKALNDILSATGIETPDHDQVIAIKEKLFTVEALPQASPKEGYDAPKGINLYKNTGGACIGQAKDSYGILQPAEFFEAINQSLKLNNYDFDNNKIAYKTRKNGSVISFEVPLSKIDFKNAKGKDDLTRVRALFTTSFDGSTSTTYNLLTERALCSNLVLWQELKKATYKFKHTPKMNARALAFSKAIIESSNGVKHYEELYKALDNVEVRTEGQINKFLENLLGYEVSDLKDLHRKRLATVEGIREGWAIERARTGNTAFGLFNAVTNYTNHIQETRADIDSHIYSGAGALLNKKAEKLAVQIAHAGL